MAREKKTDRIPEAVIDIVHELMWNAGQQLNAEDTENLGYGPWAVVDKVEAAVAREIKGFDRIVRRHWLVRQVPDVLGKMPKHRPAFWQPLLTGIVLPAFFSIPSERDDKGRGTGPAYWKRDYRVSPNEIDRVVDDKRRDIAGRQTELQKLVVIGETALRRGCDPDEAIGPYMDDRSGPSPTRPDDRPRPPP